MSLLSSEEQKNASFINMLKVFATLKNHEGLGKDIQEIYNNLPTSTNSILISITVFTGWMGDRGNGFMKYHLIAGLRRVLHRQGAACDEGLNAYIKDLNKNLQNDAENVFNNYPYNQQ
ncbi:hypothetical protein BDK51DRAFT_27641 [Blyttiomyces helicus]|uniref:Uncharacterized protein n=1 Tax=Blyttiomyces helicus TaxID=388810 RepID=A0A4P9WDG6_9FUNG|nr:hypothetical protein BDK51DRAFT_27641 [Blyttiomyces helicus]|eukprot:RKO89268.1 hypothetical protein BDK51DRAFT_27641 [Blyttiomyces helicus]